MHIPAQEQPSILPISSGMVFNLAISRTPGRTFAWQSVRCRETIFGGILGTS